MSMKEKLDQLTSQLEAIAKGDAHEDVQEMTPDQFLAYATGQIQALKNDEPEVRKARVAHLLEAIEVVKNFEGPTQGAMRIPMFKDPAQQTHSSKTAPMPPNQGGPSGTNATSTPAPQPSGTPSGPTGGGQMPPQSASSPGGASSFGGSNFAKGLAELTAALKSLTEDATDDGKGDGKGQGDGSGQQQDPPQGQQQAQKTDDGKGDGKGEREGAQKAEEPVIWPADINTKWGMGDVEDPVSPEWGFDPNSQAAKDHEIAKRQAEEAKAKKGQGKGETADAAE